MTVEIVRFFADYGSGPLWDDGGSAYILDDPDDPCELPLTPELQKALRAWAEEVGWPMVHAQHPEVIGRLRDEGLQLLARVAAGLGTNCDVRWDDNGLGP